ncbi:signal peptidase II [Oscillospiraceae bacterium LTW-04]|nr:signal peptidase II [Oscillospiraceae bacterium MB24-C1]
MSATICFILVAVLVICDQLIKLWALNSLAPIGTMMVIPGVLSFTYVENPGAAFGIFTGRRTLLIILVATILCVAAWLLLSGKIKGRLEKLSTLLIISGGLGNLIDRIRYGFVVDYIDINALFSYPMFNLADCCVVVGACLMLITAFRSEQKTQQQQHADEEKGNNGDTDSSNG